MNDEQNVESILLALEPKEPTPVAEVMPTPPEIAIVQKKQAKIKTKKVKPVVVENSTSKYLELGEGFRITHKPGSAYSVLYKVVAESGHFESTVRALNENPDLSDKTIAKKILSKMLVPIDELETLCRSESSWQEHATKKTSVLKERAEEGNEQASNLLKNAARASRGSWRGNIPEMVSTCVGSYSSFVNGSKGNKNIQKFSEAKLLFRRFRTSEGIYVMMYPEKFEPAVEEMIKKVYSE